MSLYSVLQKPIVTEKVALLSQANPVYVFQVAPMATKIDIKKAVKAIYGLEVANVNIVSVREKFKFGRKRGMVYRKRPSKKAYITLKDENATLDITAVK